MIFYLWHSLLGIEKNDLAWHQKNIADELVEYQNARGFLEKWSELSDLVYTYTRARWSDHSELKFPYYFRHFIWGSLYMFPKYTLRWLFFITAGKMSGSKKTVRAVRNPKKTEKLEQIAEKYDLDKEKFQDVCQKLLKYWILLN